MYLARFSYDVLPVNRQRAMECIRREVQAARGKGLNSRLLVPLTRGEGGAALQFEVELTSLDQLDQFRQSGVDRTRRQLDGCATSARSCYVRLRSRFCASTHQPNPMFVHGGRPSLALADQTVRGSCGSPAIGAGRARRRGRSAARHADLSAPPARRWRPCCRGASRVAGPRRDEVLHTTG